MKVGEQMSFPLRGRGGPGRGQGRKKRSRGVSHGRRAFIDRNHPVHVSTRVLPRLPSLRGRKLWEELRERDPKFTCAKLFWWHNMYSSADYSLTPRPMYPADGRKVFDVYSWPYSIRADIKKDLGEFPFPAFWGPAAGRFSRPRPTSPELARTR